MVGVVPPGTRLRPPNPADITTSFFRYQRLNGRRWEMWMSACDPGFIRPDEPALVTSAQGGATPCHRHAVSQLVRLPLVFPRPSRPAFVRWAKTDSDLPR